MQQNTRIRIIECDVDMQNQLLSTVTVFWYCFVFCSNNFVCLISEGLFSLLFFFLLCFVSVTQIHNANQGEKITHLIQYLPRNCSAKYFLHTTGSHIFILFVLIPNFIYSHIFNRNGSGLCLYHSHITAHLAKFLSPWYMESWWILKFMTF